jgi:hypothetical protein
MITKVFHKKKLYAMIIKNKYRNKKGITFFSPDNLPQQFGYINHVKNHIILPHQHKRRRTKVLYTTEIIIMLKGILRVDFYNSKNKYLLSKRVKKGELIFLMHGGHGFKVLKDAQMIEVKQGPFLKIKDKVKFKNIDEKMIKFK